MMKLRANVVRFTGATVHSHATIENGAVVPDARIPAPVAVEIEGPLLGGFSLYHLDADGAGIADTWHRTLEGAKEQARVEFCIEAADWIEVTD